MHSVLTPTDGALLDARRGGGRWHRLNETAAVGLAALLGGSNLREAALVVASRHGAKLEQVHGDMRAMCLGLVDAGLLVATDGEEAAL